MKKVIWKKELNLQEQQQVFALQNRIEGERGIYHKLDLNFAGEEKSYARHLLYWEAEQLTGYAWVTSFDPSELELTLIVSSSEDIFTELISELQRYSKEQGVASLTIISDAKDTFIAECLRKVNGEQQFSEYYMDFAAEGAANGIEQVELIKAKEADLAELEQLLGGTPLEEDLENTFLYKEENQLLACVRLEESAGHWGIYGFVVQEGLRGKGIGRKVMNTALHEILAQHPTSIYLEVETDNDSAYHLYKTEGFAIRNKYDYYEVKSS